MTGYDQGFRHWIENLPETRALLLGDLILDRYIWGDVDRISPEAPIQILDCRREEMRLGGAANVGQNLVALGAEVRCLSTVGDDPAGETLRTELRERGVNVEDIHTAPDRETPVKTRMIAQGQQVLRMDQEDTHLISESVQEQILSSLERHLDWGEIVLIGDYRKGVLPRSLLKRVFEIARSKNVPTIVDPKGRDYSRYRGVYAITPNKAETEEATGIELSDEKDYRRAANRIRNQLGAELVIITRGSEGMSLFENEDLEVHVPAEEIEVYDVTGAGDTVLATLGLVIGAGEPPLMAVRLANIAGGRAVEHLGTTVISRTDLMEFLGRPGPRGADKVVGRPELLKILEQERKKGKSIVFTNGCFDLIHEGHIHMLEFAADQGNLLVIGLNSDESISEIKGDQRPIVTQDQRSRVLSALEMVDYVTLFSEPTPESLIEDLCPDVLVKGEDWEGKTVVGQETVEAAGGRVVFAPLIEGRSTTDLIREIKQRETAEKEIPPEERPSDR